LQPVLVSGIIFTAHRSPLTAHRSPLTAHRSPLTTHRSPLLAPSRSKILVLAFSQLSDPVSIYRID